MKRVGLVSTVRELVGCLLVASFTQVQLQYRAAAAPSFTTSRVDLLHRSGFAKIKLSIQDILHADNHRITFIMPKLYAGEPEYAQTQSSAQSPLYSGQIIGAGNYIMSVGLGTPAKDLYLVLDTGSNLAWTQCLPCNACYQQNDPIFDPSASSSYQQVPCASPQCAQLGSSTGSCSSTNAPNCDYQIRYLDGSSTTEDFALETLALGGDIASLAYPFGCGHQNQGLFQGYDGIIGFSTDALAFPAQTKAAYGEIFAYCMPPVFSSTAGYIEFGASASRGGVGSGSTPLVMQSAGVPFYVVELESVQVEGTNSISEPATSKAMVVDSGTVITRLDRALYEQVRDAFKAAASGMQEAPPQGVFDTCFHTASSSLFPRITFTFMGPLAFTPVAQNSVFPVDNNGTVCLALLPLDSTSGYSHILGNYQQQGRLFTFDIPLSTLSISSDAC